MVNFLLKLSDLKSDFTLTLGDILTTFKQPSSVLFQIFYKYSVLEI